MKKILCCLTVLTFAFLVLFNYSQLPNVNANYRGMCVIDDCGQILYSYNPHMQMAMASTTKIVTAIVAIENYENLDEIITVHDNAVGIEGTSLYLRKGEQITMRNLLYGLILPSGNDAATAIAYAVAGDEETFVEMMNDFSADLGLQNTSFANPHGLDEKNHYTSAYDLAVIAAYASDNQTFVDITSTENIVLNEGEDNVRYLKNKNKLVFTQQGNIGGKTGFTDNAGRCLVNYCLRDNLKVVSVVLNCGPMFDECSRLTELAYQDYQNKVFIEPYSYVADIKVENGEQEFISLVTIAGFNKTILNEEIDNYSVEYIFDSSIIAPIEKGQVIGEVLVKYNDEIIHQDELISTVDVRNISLNYTIDNIVQNWYL